MSENYFTVLNAVNVSDHIEKKGRFSYLSWCYAVAELKKRHPEATWEVKRFDGLPYQKTDIGYFVEVAVTVGAVTHSQIHPVLDSNNRPKENPNVFDINTSIQRALVKAIALHGLGLYIYAGEDLPEGEKAEAHKPTKSGDWGDKISNSANADELRRVYKEMPEDQREAWADEVAAKRKEFGV